MSAPTDFLLELLSEEIPARMQAKARNDLARMMAESLAAAGLKHNGITTYSTPRRLALIARDLPAATEPVSEEVKGPKTAAPPQALEGFLRKTGLTQDQLQDRDGVWFAVIDKPGRATAEVLAETVAAIVRDFAWPKSMRWGAASASSATMRWVRPLHSIVALLGETIVPVAIEGVPCGASTLGHRFHHPGPITIGGAHDYVAKLRACHVLVDHAEREDIVRKGALAAAEGAGFNLVEDEGLVVENAGLTEWPVPLRGGFDADYLDVPPEVIQLTARTNQKYFVMRDGEGRLAPSFVCVANIDANDGGAAIIAGNERVLAARLSDARFFWKNDLDVKLDVQAERLKDIVFHEKLGTVADKVERVAKLAEWLVTEGIVKGASTADARRAAELCKADLVTGMVGEFPELQGVIGGYLARAQGENDAVADAVCDHYKPVGQGDEVPTAPVTVAVSLADKLDTLLSFFDIKLYPTGSKDPFALRRAAIGAISLILDNELVVQTDFPIEFWLGQSDPSQILDDRARDRRNLLTVVSEFLLDRLTVQQKEMGIRHDFISASREWNSRGDVRLDRVASRAAALQAFVETVEGKNLLAGYKRTTNILKKEQWDSAAASTTNVLPYEAALAAALDNAEPTATAAIAAEDFTAAMSALASLRAPIDAFFASVIVNDPDPAIRARRLSLLARFRDAVHAVADFSKIEG
ncbi:glycine--tRNA ligase subunit beta [Sphingomonas sp.]|uniref:glycine--tRNA ligase subunit beta n=1 Tax=Sphingomonas sp. TaxID=28214 RepID=UPI00286C9DB7|nr:glycine--tRNA ligase subunit beta [Sphingomonas sp.]